MWTSWIGRDNPSWPRSVPNLFDVEGLALVSERRIPGDHEGALDAGEIGGQTFSPTSAMKKSSTRLRLMF
jgi:hypothetical protein